jgi:hypothetical protein
MRGLHRIKIREKACPMIYYTLQDFRAKRRSSLSTGATTSIIICAYVFHVYQLRKCLRLPEEQIHLEELTVGEDLTYQEYPVKILDTSKKVTRNNHYKMSKV